MKKHENAQELLSIVSETMTHNEWPNTASMDLDGRMSLSIVLVCVCSCSASIFYWQGHGEVNEIMMKQYKKFRSIVSEPMSSPMGVLCFANALLRFGIGRAIEKSMKNMQKYKKLKSIVSEPITQN